MMRAWLLMWSLLMVGTAQAVAPPSGPEVSPRLCGSGPAPAAPAAPLPAGVTGCVAFYAAEYDPRSGRVLSALGLGGVDEVHPLASIYKGVLLEAVMRDVDVGRLNLAARYETTAAVRSIEAYPPGVNSLQTLASRAIRQSDNTAADLLHLLCGPARLARLVRGRSPCTSILLTTKGMWAAQSGLLPGVLGPEMPAGAARYAALGFEERLGLAGARNQGTRAHSGPEVEAALDLWFRGPVYESAPDLDLQPTGTARAFTDLVARTVPGANLTASRRVYREIMASGCWPAPTWATSPPWATPRRDDAATGLLGGPLALLDDAHRPPSEVIEVLLSQEGTRVVLALRHAGYPAAARRLGAGVSMLGAADLALGPQNVRALGVPLPLTPASWPRL